MKNNEHEKSLSPRSVFHLCLRHFTLAILTTVVLSGCGSGGGGGGGDGSAGNNPPADSAPADSSGTAVVQGLLSLPSSSAESPTDYVVYNSFQSVTPTANGSLSIAVSQSGLTVTYAALKSGKKVYSAMTTGAAEPVNINARSTAEALVLLNPLLIPDSVEEQARIISQVRSDSAVSALATVIETVFASVEDPLSDARILEAARDAALSVLDSLSTATISSTSTTSSATVTSAISSNLLGALSIETPTALIASAATPSIVIREGDMGALDLDTSSGATLRLVPATVGRWGTPVKTNVDWVAKIIELDSSKLQWIGNSPTLPSSPLTTNELDNLVKPKSLGGYEGTVIVRGEILADDWALLVDPVGKTFDKIGEILGGFVFPEDGVVLPHDGVYAVVALSGSPGSISGEDAVEFASVMNSSWQSNLWIQALSINIFAVALDVADVAATIVSSGTVDTDLILDPVIRAVYPLIVQKVHDAVTNGTLQNDISAPRKNFFFETLSFAKDELIAAGSKGVVETAATKRFTSAALKGYLLAPADVWSGSIATGTRLLNLFQVTPKEVGYVIVGSPSAVRDQTAPSAPTELTAAFVSSTRVSLAWSASTDNVSVAGYRLYRNGVSQGTGATTSRYDTVLGDSTQYCYEISAYDATGNESARSNMQCIAQAAAPATPGSFTALSQTQGSIALGWLDNSDNETGFKIERKVGAGGSFVQIAVIGPRAGIGSGGSYQDSDLAAGTTYCYRLRAYNLIGDSSFTGESCATAQASTSPVPGSFILSNDPPVCDLNSPTVRLKWGASSDATTYDVYRDGVLYKPTATTGTSFNNIANLIAGQSYSYYVVAKNASGSTPSNTIAVVIPSNICPPTTTDTIKPIVSGFSVTPGSLTAGSPFTISYTISDTGGSGLWQAQLWRAPDIGGVPGAWAKIATNALTGNGPVSGSFTDAPTTGAYWYGVHGVDTAVNIGVEPNGAKVVVNPAAIGTPSTPTGTATSGVIGTASGPGPVTPSSTVNMSWNTSSGTGVDYNLIVTDVTSNTQALNIRLAGNTYTTALTAGHQYNWQVAACNTTGCSSYTAAQYFQTPGTTLPTPTLSSISPNLITQGVSYTNVTFIGTGFTASSWPYFTTSLGASQFATSAPTINNSTSMTVAVSNTTAQTITWKVCAANGSSTCSNTQTVTVQPAAVSIPATPTGTATSGVIGTSSGPGPVTPSSTVNMSWNSVSGTGVDYNLIVTDNTNNTQALNIRLAGNTYTTPLTAGHQYSWKVAACNTTGCSPYTAAQYFQTPGTVADTTLPQVAITSPGASGTTVYVSSSSLGISGTASDNVGVTQVTWANDRGGSGVASGTTSWSVSSITLQSGWNTITVTARDAAGNLNLANLIVNYTIVPSTPIERITNGSFTSGTSGWSLASDFWAGTNLTRYRTSPGYASGGVDSTGLPKNNASGSMYQTVAIPSNATSATLSFYLNITSDESSTTTQYDKLFVDVLNSSGTLLTTLAIYSNIDKGPACGTTCDYTQKIFNLISYKGQTIRIQFRATTDSSTNTVFRIDDISLMSDGN